MAAHASLPRGSHHDRAAGLAVPYRGDVPWWEEGAAMTVDVRFRADGGHDTPVDADIFFADGLPALVDESGESMRDALTWLALEPLTVEIGDDAWTLRAAGQVHVDRGRTAAGAAVRLTPGQFTELVTDRATFMGFFTHGTLVQTSGRLENLLDWWLVLRSLIDHRPIHTPGEPTFTTAGGTALDLHRSSGADDDPAEMKHFLEEAGYLHIRGLFTEDEMRAIDRDMDRLASEYAPNDERSWWATTADGVRRLVRMQQFETLSGDTSSLLRDGRFLRLGEIPGDGHRWRGTAQALTKPIGVTEGISDVPWHKDCSLGRHSYDCCSLTVGISVTGADRVSGQLRVVAGSHRVLVWPTFAGRDTGLPEVDLPTRTGDVTVHLSCTKHMSQPPVSRERRVLYTGFALPPTDPDAAAEEHKRLYRIMRSIPDGVSQRPSTVATTAS